MESKRNTKKFKILKRNRLGAIQLIWMITGGVVVCFSTHEYIFLAQDVAVPQQHHKHKQPVQGTTMLAADWTTQVA